MQFLSWLLWSVKCHCCCFFSSPSWNYRSENRNYRNKQPPLKSNHLKTCKIYKYSSANANFSKSSHKGHKTKGQILKHSNDSLWTKPSEILAFTAMFRIYCIPRTLRIRVPDARLSFDYLIIKLNLNKGGANYFMFISAAAVLPKDNRGINWSCNL